jgi:hypothetical protein
MSNIYDYMDKFSTKSGSECNCNESDFNKLLDDFDDFDARKTMKVIIAPECYECVKEIWDETR